MIYTFNDPWGHGSRLVAVADVTYRVTNRRRRWAAAVRCSCGHRPHWHDIATRRTERAMRVALAATALNAGTEHAA